MGEGGWCALLWIIVSLLNGMLVLRDSALPNSYIFEADHYKTESNGYD